MTDAGAALAQTPSPTPAADAQKPDPTYRFSAGPKPGQVTLQVLSAVTHQVKVAGYTSCSDDLPCPTGKVCQPNQVCSP